MNVRGELLGTIEYGGRTFELRWQDALWAARMLVGEEGWSHRAGYEAGRVILSSMVRRWVQVLPSWPSLERVLRGTPESGDAMGYSDPVRFDSTPNPRIESIEWERVPEFYRRAVLDTMTGRVPLAARGVVHFANRDFTLNKINNPQARGHDDAVRERWQIVPSAAKNATVTTARSRVAAEPVVRGGSGLDPKRLLLVGGSVLALAGVGVVWLARGGIA